MITLRFVKDEQALDLHLDRVNERPITNTMNGSFSVNVDDENDFVDLSGFVGCDVFERIEAYTGDGVQIPLSCEYNKIEDLFTNYDDKMKMYTMSVVVGKLN